MGEITTYSDLASIGGADPHNPRRNAIFLVIVLLLGAVLRLSGLGTESFWYDESLTTLSARVPFPQIIGAVRQHENAPPFYFVLINLWAKVFGSSDVALRWPSALLGIATIGVLYCLGRELFDQTIGLTAAALLAVSPIHIAYSQEARMYALALLINLLCVWAFTRLLRSGSGMAQLSYVAMATLAALYALVRDFHHRRAEP